MNAIAAIALAATVTVTFPPNFFDYGDCAVHIAMREDDGRRDASAFAAMLAKHCRSKYASYRDYQISHNQLVIPPTELALEAIESEREEKHKRKQ